MSLVAPPEPTLRSWSATILAVSRQHWRPVLLVTGFSVSVPLGLVELSRTALGPWARRARRPRYCSPLSNSS
ncbi:hypothetical protein [Actinoplanes sp. NPDC051851]|uniref:hypothetical protein n=1 Tax=Actinoplanes sp. NPDC051851 TaxID=3154753 RepID=UPI00341C7387